MDEPDQGGSWLERRKRNVAKKWCAAGNSEGNLRNFACVGITHGEGSSEFRKVSLSPSRKRQTSSDVLTK